VASGFFPASSASAISRVVMGTADRRSVSTTALASVPRLNHGLPVLRRLALIALTLKPGWSICSTASTQGDSFLPVEPFCPLAILFLNEGYSDEQRDTERRSPTENRLGLT
jgi:hypothetical protein